MVTKRISNAQNNLPYLVITLNTPENGQFITTVKGYSYLV